MTALPATVYDSSLNNSEHPQLAPPGTPSRSSHKDFGHRRSPTKLLRSAKPVPDYDEFQALLDSDITTAAEKELASRVVRAAERLKGWCAEIEQWGWTGSFEARPGMHDASSQSDGNLEEQEYSGSIPLEQVDAYESRLDTIDDELTSLEVDELKEQVLGIHIGRSRPSSGYSSTSLATNITLYDDFQLFVTETLIHALPHHARLKHHLRVWTARLAVLVEVPSFLRETYQFFTILNRAYHPLQFPLSPFAEPTALKAVEKQLVTAQNDLRYKVGQLGKQLDRMLDILEESDDQLPEKWIDKFEADETEYTNWSYEADKKLFQIRMLETALANHHDMSAWVPPDSHPVALTSTTLEPIAPDCTLHGQARRDGEAADVHESFESMMGKSIPNHAGGDAGGAISATTSVTLPNEFLPHVLVEKTDASAEIPFQDHANDGGNGIAVKPMEVMSEETTSGDVLLGSDDPSEVYDLGVAKGHGDETSRETAILSPKSVEDALAHTRTFDQKPRSSLRLEADSDDPSLTDTSNANVETLFTEKGPVVTSHDFIEFPQGPETSATRQDSLSSDPAIPVRTDLSLESDTTADEAHRQQQTASFLDGPEEALRKLEGNARDPMEMSALAPMNFGNICEATMSPGAASSPTISHALPVDEADAQDDNDGTEDVVAVGWSSLNTGPKKSTNNHHFAPSFVRRASATSIESFSRDKVKTVTLSRRNSANLSRRGSASTLASVGESSSSLPLPPNGTSMEGLKVRNSFASPLSASTKMSDQDHELSRPTTPTFKENNHSVTSLLSSATSDASQERQVLEDSPSLRVRERVTGPKPPLNWAMRKRRGIDVDSVMDTARSISSPLSDVEASRSPTPGSPSSSSSVRSPKSPMMPFEEQLSSVLDALPASIRLKSSSSHNAPTITSKNRMTSASQPYQPRSRAATPTVSTLPTLTLAPAEESSSRRSGVNDPEIKTYNLISGKDKPIKLYIRRVGENGERIMVRVGGGWSDLGEWLRNYADHHGRRAASGSAFEVVQMTPPVHDPGVITPISTTTPASRRASMADSIGSSAIHGTTLLSSSSGSRTGAASPAFVEKNTPSNLQTPVLGNEEFPSNTPPTGGSVHQIENRKVSNPWDEGAAGLMGPAIAKKERPLSKEKSRWVDGVVEQAKRTVGKDGGKGTRRVFLKGKGVE
ncbi:hypothetical protein FKW77_003547 [Venturia effusa]|uniref:GAR domain-containing protein n=1 Tax=Venturia effusa TaxID=50376 RepID=A0A517LDJ6_9PEZI|nr:hypothetical protein FKW77_003547 [Venturia effusa]